MTGRKTTSKIGKTRTANAEYATAENWVQRQMVAPVDHLGAPGVQAPMPWSPDREQRYRSSYMTETNGGGRVESVPGFDPARALTVGLPGAIPSLRRPGPIPETVFESDRRVQVVSTELIPWRSICNLAIQYDQGRSSGTAWFVGPGLLMTAGHCIYDHQHGGGAAKDIVIYPGRNGASTVGTPVRTASVWVHQGWIQTGNRELDYGFLSINETMLGQHLGYFGFVDIADTIIDTTVINVAGYPYDKPDGTLWFDSGRIVSQDQHFLYYQLDTEAGNSGGPVFWYGKNQERIGFAIHTYGDTIANRGRRITAEIFDKIVELRGF